MLTTNDIQLLDNLLEKKLEEKLEQKLDQKLDEKLDLKLKPVIREIKRQGKKLDTFIRLYDGEHTHLRKLVDRIDDHLNLEHLQYKR